MKFSPEVILSSWKTITPVIFSRVEQSPSALAGVCGLFCAKMAMVLGDSLADFAEILKDHFAQARKFQLRRLFARLASSMAVMNHRPQVVRDLWTVFPLLSRDSVDSVRGSVPSVLMKLRKYFSTQGDVAHEKEVMGLFMSFSKDASPYIRDVWTTNWKLFNQSLGQQDAVDRPMEPTGSMVFDKRPKGARMVPSASSELHGLNESSILGLKDGGRRQPATLIGHATQKALNRPKIVRSPTTLSSLVMFRERNVVAPL
jgi:hypothetical protein